MGRKYAVKNCRSGYKPTKEEEHKIKTGEILLAVRHLFAFPTETSLRAQWVGAIGRQDEWDQDYSAVCELHFRQQDFEDDPSLRTGMQRQRRRLKSGAVPPIFRINVECAMPPVHERPAKLATASARSSHQEQVMKDQIDAFFANGISDQENLYDQSTLRDG